MRSIIGYLGCPLLIRRRRKQNEVAVGVFHDESLGLPRLVPQRLVERNGCDLPSNEELLDLLCAAERDGSREQILLFTDASDEDGVFNKAQCKSDIVTAHLSVEWRITVDEIESETKFVGKELGRDSKVANIELRGCGGEYGLRGRLRLGHCLGISCSQRLPSFKTLFACNKLLRIYQPKCCCQNFLIGKQTESGQVFPYRGSDRIIAITMPPQILLWLVF
jgi:hypothetical protein